jgi:L-aminoadipate-semialdehyde dehydrogenase
MGIFYNDPCFQVHWVYPYAKLRSANVLSTLSVIDLASTGKAKMVSFVSSTSALDTEYYVRLSDSAIAAGGLGVLESDDLEGARTGLKTGYGQTKWVAEKLLMEASRRGLPCRIVRPGYVVGDSKFAGEFNSITIMKSYADYKLQ